MIKMALGELGMRDQMRMLKILSALLGPLILAWDIISHFQGPSYRYAWPDVLLFVVVAVFMAVPYLFKRMPYRIMARLLVFLLLVAVISMGLPNFLFLDKKGLNPAYAELFIYLVLPLLLASGLLPLIDTVVVAVCTIAFILFLPLLLPNFTYQAMGPSLYFLLLAVPAIVFITNYRERLEWLRTLEIRKSEERFRNLADMLPLAVFETDLVGNLKFINQAGCRYFGYAAAELQNNFHVAQIIATDDREKLKDSFRRALDGETLPETEYTALCKDGHTFPISGYASRIMTDDQPAGIRSVVIDISERKAAEQHLAKTLDALTRSNRDLEQFAYVSSHDLQEPLRMVSSYLQLLEKRYGATLTGDAREFMDYAIDGANRMQNMIRDLLTYSRVNTQAQPLKPTNMQQVYDAALMNLQQAIADSQAVITSDTLPGIMGNDIQLVQLLQNLLGNAIKFRDGNPPAIHVGVMERGGLWCFSVRDNGIGIDMQYKERIFMIFQRLHSRDKYSGSGIGLAVCKRIVEQHGGEIWLESAPEKGSTFYFTLQKAV